LPKAPVTPVETGVAADLVKAQYASYLASPAPATAPGSPPSTTAAAAPGDSPVPFVCEEDVRQAVKAGRKIVIGARSLVTPAARDLGEQHRIFVQAGLVS
jgi:hypothetical protein